MQNRPWEYIVMASKSWGRAISGPVLAVIGLVLLVCQVTITDSQKATLVFKYLSWATLGAAGLMIFVAQYEVWKDEREKCEAEISKNTLPEIIGEITTALAQPAKPSGIGDTMLYLGSHLLRLYLSVRNVRAVDTNIAAVKFKVFEPESGPPLFFIFDVSVYSRPTDGGQEKIGPGIILKRGIVTELEVTGYAKFPSDYVFPDAGFIDASSLEAVLTDGFGGTHRIPARDGLKLYAMGDS